MLKSKFPFRAITLVVALLLSLTAAFSSTLELSRATGEIATLNSIFAGLALSLLSLPKSDEAAWSAQRVRNWKGFLGWNLVCLLVVLAGAISDWPKVWFSKWGPLEQFGYIEFLAAICLTSLVTITVFDFQKMLMSETYETPSRGGAQDKPQKTQDVVFPSNLTKEHAKQINRN